MPTEALANIMIHKRVEQALRERRHAIHKLRMGDRFSHRELMRGASFFLKLAREWRPK